MIKLTGTPHPDYGNVSKPLYVDPARVIYIERSFTSWTKEGAHEEHRQALQQLGEEVERIVAELTKLGFNVDTEEQMQTSVRMRDSSAALSAAANLVTRASSQRFYHPRIECTTLGLAYGDGGGNMLARVHVMESPEEVAAALLAPVVVP